MNHAIESERRHAETKLRQATEGVRTPTGRVVALLPVHGPTGATPRQQDVGITDCWPVTTREHNPAATFCLTSIVPGTDVTAPTSVLVGGISGGVTNPAKACRQLRKLAWGLAGGPLLLLLLAHPVKDAMLQVACGIGVGCVSACRTTCLEGP